MYTKLVGDGLKNSSHLTIRILVSIYDVKFYPYLDPGEDPVFAAVGGREVEPQQYILRYRNVQVTDDRFMCADPAPPKMLLSRSYQFSRTPMYVIGAQQHALPLHILAGFKVLLLIPGRCSVQQCCLVSRL